MQILINEKLLFLLMYFLHLSQGQFRSPEITEHPSDILVPKNEPATLNCHADGKPEPKITWFKDGKVFNEGIRHVILKNGDLFFLRVLQTKRENDSGTYWCQAKNRVGVKLSKKATLEIAVLKDEFLAEPKDTHAAEGTAVLLHCTPPKGYPDPVVVWAKDHIELDFTTHHRYKVTDEGNLLIKDVRSQDSGVYTCRARNVYATKESKPAFLSVLVPPHLVFWEKEVVGTSGDTVELICRVGGDPPPEIFWERAHPEDLPVERMTQEERGQVLRISQVIAEDEGQYICRAENPVGIVKANVSLKVHSRPVISKSPENVRVALEGIASFDCRVSGYPKPTIYWTKEKNLDVLEPGQTSENGRKTVDRNNTLTIKGVTTKDAGIYMCSAVGVAGSTIARAKLEVLDPRDMPPPIIALGAVNQTLPLGTEADLPCDAVGTPHPKVNWFAKGERLKVNKKLTVTPLGTLRITNLKISDTDIYTCKATSASGTTILITSLIVAKPTNPNVAFFKMPNEGALPEPPRNVAVQEVNTTDITLSWSRGRPGSSSIQGYNIEMWSPDLRGGWKTVPASLIPSNKMLVYSKITDLKPNTRYLFLVRATNSHGVSRPSEITPIVKTHISNNADELSLSNIRNRLSLPLITIVDVKPTKPGSLSIKWNIADDEDIIDTLLIRYRTTIVLEETIHGPINVEIVKLSDKEKVNLNKYVLSDLMFNTHYELFLVPVSRGIEGQPTPAVRVLTLEMAPSVVPEGLNYTVVNKTSVRFTWIPTVNPKSNQPFGRYNLQVLDVTKDSFIHINETSDDTWALVNSLKPGSSYNAKVRVISTSGEGPFSNTIGFKITPKGEFTWIATLDSIEHSNDLASNEYIILIITGAALIIFATLFTTVIIVFRRRKGYKCPSYLTKVDDREIWSDYPTLWDNGTKNMCVTSAVLSDTFGTNTTQFGSIANHSRTETSFKPSSLFNEYCEGTFDNLYEDPDGFKLISLMANPDKKRGKSPVPYATTTLISNKSHEFFTQLPPNIPLQDRTINHHEPIEGNQSFDSQETSDEEQSSKQNGNFTGDIVTQTAEINAMNVALSTFKPEFTAAYLRQQEERNHPISLMPLREDIENNQRENELCNSKIIANTQLKNDCNTPLIFASNSSLKDYLSLSNTNKKHPEIFSTLSRHFPRKRSRKNTDDLWRESNKKSTIESKTYDCPYVERDVGYSSSNFTINKSPPQANTLRDCEEMKHEHKIPGYSLPKLCFPNVSYHSITTPSNQYIYSGESDRRHIETEENNSESKLPNFQVHYRNTRRTPDVGLLQESASSPLI